jgi:acyl carrier protein
MAAPDETDLIAARLTRILARTLVMGAGRLGARPIGPGLRLAEDLCAGSIDRVMIVMAVEEEWGIRVSDDEAAALVTAGDIVALILARRDTDRQLRAAAMVNIIGEGTQ